MSDSEGFESADEGHESIEKTERKKRQSSSNYSDSDYDTTKKTNDTATKKSSKDALTDGWDDFEVEDDVKETKADSQLPSNDCKLTKVIDKEKGKSQDTGWDDFGDWEQDNAIQEKQAVKQPDTNIQSVADRLAASSVKEDSGGWGWGGWGVDSLLSSATAGISTITNQVSQGISTVLETGIGAPDPEELARKSAAGEKSRGHEDSAEQTTPSQKEAGDAGSFPFGNILSGVTKFVESTGTKVLAGGLDTLETIGKKTMEVLQDGDPGLVKKRAMLGLDPAEKPVLSQLLREAKEKADEEDRIREEKREAKEVHYETLFDDFEGLVRLEALEMLSRQARMRIEDRLRAAAPPAAKELRETLQQVAELCDITEEDEDDDDDVDAAADLQQQLLHATQELGAKLHFQPIVKVHTDALASLATERPPRELYRAAVSALAHSTALATQLYHVTGQLLAVQRRRSTAGEAHAARLMTLVLIKHTSELATKFTEKLNSIEAENKEQINTYITNIFLEAGNSSTYIQDAFQLILPIIQVGAM